MGENTGVREAQVRRFKIGVGLVGRGLMFIVLFCTSDIFLLQPIAFMYNSGRTDLRAAPCLTMG